MQASLCLEHAGLPHGRGLHSLYRTVWHCLVVVVLQGGVDTYGVGGGTWAVPAEALQRDGSRRLVDAS
jgi:hypothetical protein